MKAAAAFPLQYGKTPLPDDVKRARMTCALGFITNLLAQGVPVIGLTDEYSNGFFSQSGADLFLDDGSHPTYGAAKRFTMKKAIELYGKDIFGVLMTEPEKVELAEHIDKITEPVESGCADIVVVGRANLSRSLLTYPWHQRDWEMYGNTVCEAVMGRSMDYDYFFAPRFVGRQAWQSYLGFPGTAPKDIVPDVYDANYAQLYLAIKLGLKIKQVLVPFAYPADQKAAEESEAATIQMVERRLNSLPLLVGSMLKYKKWLDAQPDPAATISMS